ncbi:MAG: hypothetical protein PVG79_13420 [Gemmatimonadales bacterium]|jgi:opacity protein-like surface antigen
MGRVQLRRVFVAVSLPGLLLALVATDTGAQDFEGRRSRDQTGLGLALMFAQPLGEFGYYVDESLGLGAFLHFDVGRNGALGLRLDGSMVYHGSQTQTRSFAVGPGIVDFAEVTVRNRIGSFFVGPQMTLSTGDVRPYLHAGAGFSYFWTGTDWRDSCDCYGWEDHGCCDHDLFDVMGDLAMFFEGETEHSHWTAAWTAGGGVAVSLGRGLDLYLAVQYVNNGRVSYLPEGAIIDHGNGYYSFTPVESDGNLLLAQFGITIQ